MNTLPVDKYRALMRVLRSRFDMIEMLKRLTKVQDISAAGTAAFGFKAIPSVRACQSGDPSECSCGWVG